MRANKQQIDNQHHGEGVLCHWPWLLRSQLSRSVTYWRVSWPLPVPVWLVAAERARLDSGPWGGGGRARPAAQRMRGPIITAQLGAVVPQCTVCLLLCHDTAPATGRQCQRAATGTGTGMAARRGSTLVTILQVFPVQVAW